MSENSNLKPFSQVLREFRKEYGLTLEELSKMVKVPAQTLNRYELGQRVPKVDVVNEMAIRLGVNPMWLLGYSQYDAFEAFVDGDLPPDRISAMGVYSLNNDEKELLITYRKLNPTGQEKALEYARDMLDNAKYREKQYIETVDQEDSNPKLYRARARLGITSDEYPEGYHNDSFSAAPEPSADELAVEAKRAAEHLDKQHYLQGDGQEAVEK